MIKLYKHILYVATNLRDSYNTDDRNFRRRNAINIYELILDNLAILLHIWRVKNIISSNWNLARNIFACQVHGLFVPNKNPRDEISQNKHLGSAKKVLPSIVDFWNFYKKVWKNKVFVILCWQKQLESEYCR